MQHTTISRRTCGLCPPRPCSSPTLYQKHRPFPLIRRPQAAAVSLPVGNHGADGKDDMPAAEQGVWQRLNPQWWQLQSPVESAEAEGPPARTPLLPLLGKILKLVVHDKLLLCTASVFMVLAAVAELAIPHFATSCIFSAAATGATKSAYQSNLTTLAGIVVFYGVFSALRGYCFSILNNRMTMRLRTRLFGNLVRRETAFFDSTDIGAMTSRLQADCQAMTKCVATNLNIAFRNMLQAIGGVTYLAVTSPLLCAATLGVCVILWAITLFYGDYARRTQKIFQDTLACGNQVAEEVLSLSKVVRTFGTEDREESRYTSWLQRLYMVGLRQATGYGLFVASGHIACYMTKVVALTLGCALLVKGAMTAEQLTNFIFYVEFVTYASLSACDETVEVLEAVGASERVLTLLEGPPAPQIAAGSQPNNFRGHVQFKDVSFRYPTRPNHLALDNVNLELKPGQLVALVGLSGSGKTTLVALLQRLYDPTSGSILIDGHELSNIDASWYRANIGVVSQEPKLFGTTIAENISYGCEGITQADVEDAARQANAHDFIMSLPQGYETKVTDRLLSGGQKQRIALARALIRKPGLLILDEATSALDAESEAQVQSALDAAMLSRSRTVVVIAHRLSTVRHADVTIVMDKGQVVERGTHDSLLKQNGIYAKLVSRQQSAGRDLSQATLNDNHNNHKHGANNHHNRHVSANGNGSVLIANGMATVGSSSDDDSRFQGVSSSDESNTAGGNNASSNGGNGNDSNTLTIPSAPTAADVELVVAAAAAVTAENELSSKMLGSQDYIDWEGRV